MRHHPSPAKNSDLANAIVDCLPYAVVVLDERCHVIAVNPAFTVLSGLKQGEVTGRSFPNFAQKLWGADDMAERLSMLEPAGESTWEFRAPEENTDLIFRGFLLNLETERFIALCVEDVALERRRQQEVFETSTWEGELQRTRSDLRELKSQIFRMKEDEARKVSRDLHDDIGQRLSLITLKLHALQPAAAQRELLAQSMDALQQISTDLRRISHQLHPASLDDVGLAAALRSLVSDFGDTEEMLSTFTSYDVPETISDVVAIAAYRITQEALRNVSKHAGRTQVKVELRKELNSLLLQIRDHGNGFDEESVRVSRGQGLGLINMKDRARFANGTLTIHSARGRGTVVVAEFPLEAQ